MTASSYPQVDPESTLLTHPHPTSSWDTIASVFYRSQKLYTLPWTITDLSDYLVAAARSGGPVALLRTEPKIGQGGVTRSGADLGLGMGGAGIGGHGKYPKIMVYTSSGQLIASFSWDLSQPVHLSWTSDERLFVLAEDGTYRLYSLSSSLTGLSSISTAAGTTNSSTAAAAAPYRQFTLGSDVSEMGVISAQAYEGGVVILTGGLGFLHLRLPSSSVASSGFSNPRSGSENTNTTSGGGGRATPLAESGLTDLPLSWTLLSPDQSPTGHIQVLVATSSSSSSFTSTSPSIPSSTVLSLDELDRVDQHLSKGPFTHIRASPNGRFLALLTERNTLWVVTSDFARNLSEVDVGVNMTGNENEREAANGYSLDYNEGVGGDEHGDKVKGGVPEMMEWCGNDAVTLSWPGGQVSVVGPQGDALNFFHSPSAYLISEIDGLRILSSSSCDFVQKVPSSSLAVFQPGSSEPAAILYEAMEQFERSSPKADENIRAIRPDLAEAVDIAIDAAGNETEPYWQKRLLKTAMFGRAFLDLYNPTDLVHMAQTLKVLNAVRSYEVGIPLTYQQYISSNPERLISRLLSRNLHLLALRISTHLNLRPDPVLKHWACAKIAAHRRPDLGDSSSTTLSDDELCKMIVRKFEREGGKGVNYADIARTAWQLGRTKLATILLDHERQAAEQVPLLLSMKEDKLALVKAIDSGDTDLVFHVLLHLKARLSPGDLFTLVDDGTSKMAPAVKLLQLYARDADRSLLRDFYYQDDRRLDSACLELLEAAETDRTEERLLHLKNAAKYLNEDKERSFEAKMVEDAHRLLAVQQEWEKETDHQYQFVGLGLNDTLQHSLLIGLGKRAEKLKNEFKVPDKQWWWLKLKALAENKDWEGLEVFAKSKKSPIGYEPFVNHLVSINQHARATAFVPRCDSKSRVDLYLKCQDWGKAAQECKDRGDKARLQDLRRMAPNSLAQREVDEVITRVGK